MPQPATKKSGVVVPNEPRWFEHVAGFLVYLLLTVCAFTLRCKWIDRSGLGDAPKKGPHIFAIWHNRLSLSMMIFTRYVRPHSAASGLAVMASASKDGGLLCAVLTKFGVQPARGSSSRRGAQALRELTSWARRNYDLAITPDGPRGPVYQLQEGIVSLAQLTGLSIIPTTFNLTRQWRIKSWDNFIVPMPFSKCEIILEKPVTVPRESTAAQREAIRAALQATLMRISEP